jgi:PAS domain S-box-containing protein
VADSYSDLSREELIARLQSASIGLPDQDPNPVFQVTPDGEVCYANSAARRVLVGLGWVPGELVIEPFRSRMAALRRGTEVGELELYCPCGHDYAFTLVAGGDAGPVNVYGHDVSRRKQTEATLRDSEQRLALLAGASMDGVVITEGERIVDCNAQAARIIGRTVVELKGMSVARVLSQEDYGRALARVRSGQDSNAEYTIRHADGSLIPVWVSGRSLGGGPGHERRLVLVRDISGPRQRERTLNQLNRTLRAIQHSGQALLRATDEQAYLAEVCQNVVADCGHRLAWVGYLEDDLDILPVAWAGHEKGYLTQARFSKADAEHGQSPVGAAVRAGALRLCRDILNDPRSSPWREQALERGYRSVLALPLLAAGRAFGAIEVYSVTPDAFSEQEVALLAELAEDLAFGIQTLRLRRAHALTEAALRESQSDLNRAQAIGQIGSWRLDVRMNKLTWSAENHRLFGIPEGTPLSYESFLAAVHPDDRDYVDRMWTSALEGAPYDIEHRVLSNGQVRWVRERAEMEFDAAGVLIGGFGTTLDITERRRMERSLQRSEARFRELVEQTSDGIMVHDSSGRIVDVNPACAEMHGYTRQEMLRLSLGDLVMPDEQGRLAGTMADVQAGHARREEWQSRRKDGSTFVTEVVVRRLSAGREQAIIRDITERRRAEAYRIRELERQRDALVREVHHRIKNHLQGVIALMRNRSEMDAGLAPALGEAISQIDTIAQVYGLQARSAGSQITLDGLVDAAVRSAVGTRAVDIRFDSQGRSTGIDPAEVVPIALVVNELIINAAKHVRGPVDGRPASVLLSVDDERAVIGIRNGPAALPDGFDFEGGVGLGTGLELVRGLLPPKGARLSFATVAEEVVVELCLRPPVVLTQPGA